MTGEGRRLVIASESLGGAEAALVLARKILELSPANLTGIIVAPEENAVWAGHDQSLVSSSGAAFRMPPHGRLLRFAEKDVAALGARISSLARDMNAESDCALSAGELVSVACMSVRGDDILFLGQRPLFKSQSRVLVLGTERGVSEASRRLGETLAGAMASTLTVLAEETEMAQEDLAVQIERQHVGAVVLELGRPVDNEDSLRRIFAAARCPVVVLGAARIRQVRAVD